MLEEQSEFTPEEVRLMEEHFAPGRVSVQLNIENRQLERVRERPYFRDWDLQEITIYREPNGGGWQPVPFFREAPSHYLWNAYLDDRNCVYYDRTDKVLKLKTTTFLENPQELV